MALEFLALILVSSIFYLFQHDNSNFLSLEIRQIIDEKPCRLEMWECSDPLIFSPSFYSPILPLFVKIPELPARTAPRQREI
jgi:hypothetical protein